MNPTMRHTALEDAREPRAGLNPRRLAVAAITLATAAWWSAAPAAAQSFFPNEPVNSVFSDDFNAGTGAWTAYGGGTWTTDTGAPACFDDAASDWSPHLLETTPLGSPSPESLFLISASSSMGAEWTNIRFDVDIHPASTSVMGFAFAVSADFNGDGSPDDGYFFILDSFPAEGSGDSATWRLIKRESDTNTVLGVGIVDLPTTDPLDRTLYSDRCYRLRLEWVCGNMRVRVRRYDSTGSPHLSGCSAACSDADPEACWCDIVQWTEPVALAQGSVGLFASSSDAMASADNRFDNVEVSSWTEDCYLVCDAWPTTWTEAERDHIAFKHLYNAAISEIEAYGKTDQAGTAAYDVDVDARTPTSSGTNSDNTSTPWCNGWNLLVDLPAYNATVDNLDTIRAYLEPMASAVEWRADGSGGLSWQDTYNQDPASASFNPIPVVARGSTPINASLLDAYDWIEANQAGPDGAWFNDPLKSCRTWYIILISDGEEACHGDACTGSPPTAELLRDADVTVYGIGFSSAVAQVPDTSPLKCVPAVTGGSFFPASNANELLSALNDTFTNMVETDRSFIPYKVSPPPAVSTGSGAAEDLLAVYPIFVPRNQRSIWSGTLYAFALNESQPTIPADGSCEIDLTQSLWDAEAVLAAQAAAGHREVFMGIETAGVWARHDLLDIATDATVRAVAEPLMRPPDQPSTVLPDAAIQEMVNFIRNIWSDDLSGAVPSDPRPSGATPPWPALGDSYHSQPLVVNPPNNASYAYDTFGGSTEVTDYRAFVKKHRQRRRMIFIGANDSQFHAFDGGYYDRDVAGQHDLGNGGELFAYTPQAVMDRFYGLTFTENHEATVDGRVVAGDVFIDSDGDGNNEWRTVTIGTLRSGGQSLFALDVTQPDQYASFADGVGEVPDWVSGSPPNNGLPTCTDGSTSGCDGDFPRVLWEFSDVDSSGVPNDDESSGYADLGYTWSRPAIVRVGTYNASGPPDSEFVAFFGGGWNGANQPDYVNAAATGVGGNWIYGVDIETGAVLYKEDIGVPVAAGVRALDSNNDGYHDRVYFADTNGGIWRIQLPDPTTTDAAPGTIFDATAATPAITLTKIFDLSGLPGRIYFFQEPITVPAVFNGGSYTYGLALGSGFRPKLDYEGVPLDATTPEQTDYIVFVLDVGDTTTRTEADLVNLSYADLVNLNTAPVDPPPDPPVPTEACASDNQPLDTVNGNYGWYLSLRPNEKTTFEAAVVAGFVNIATFEPGDDPATDPPYACPPETDDTDYEVEVCRTAGVGRAYKLWYECAIDESQGSGYYEVNDLITGQETSTTGGTTNVTFTTMDPGGDLNIDYPHVSGYAITNWRQR